MAHRATVTLHTSPKTKERLETLAHHTRCSKSFLTNEAVEQYAKAEQHFIAAVEEGLADAEAQRLVSTEQTRTELRKRTN